MSTWPMESTEKSDGIELAPPAERRQHKRFKLPLPVGIHSVEPEHRELEEVRNVLNFSEAGIYFTTWLEDYAVGMKLLVTLPYSSVDVAHRQCLGKVVRVAHLTNGSLGIAVQFLS